MIVGVLVIEYGVIYLYVHVYTYMYLCVLHFTTTRKTLVINRR